jgi:hypothetical protein
VGDEGQPLGRGQRLQDDQQRRPDRVGQQRLGLGVGPAGVARQLLGQLGTEEVLAPGAAIAEHVQRHPADHRGQPAAQVLHAAGAGAAEPQPRLLDGVVGLGGRAQHPVGHRPQMRPVLLEPLGQPVVVVHR